MSKISTKKPLGQQTTILLADDCGLVRKEFRQLLEQETVFKILGEAKNGQQAVNMSLKLRPAIVLMDVSMPVLNGLEATRAILRALPETKVVFLSAHNDEDYIMEAVKAGAMGYLLKQHCADDLRRTIEAVHQGKTAFSPSIPKFLQQRAKNIIGERLVA